tara:strand:- start:13909 stop:14313 length:405 start_codon:yes stop_codon:yes gene_type:complete
MIEVNNISGADSTIIFPDINGIPAAFEFNNAKLSRDAGFYEHAYIKQLVITNSHSAEITVTLSMFDTTEDEQGVISENTYYVLKDLPITLANTLVLDQYDLAVIDLQRFGLKIQLGDSAYSASLMYELDWSNIK